jgi:monoamine oxidase
VIVVGAGLAGLGAAKSLTEQGAEVVLLEVKPHIGGRLLTYYSMGAPFEYGAGCIHGPSEENPTKQLADAVNAQTIVTDNDSMTVFDDEGEELDDDELEEIDEDWYGALGKVDEELELNDSRSLRQAVKDLVPVR